MDVSNLSVTVLLPVYNESNRLPTTLDQIRPFLDSNFRAYEVLVVDDGSSDGTGLVVEERAREWPELRFERLPRHKGKGAAVRHGCLQAKHDFVLFMDADLPTPIQHMLTFLQPLVEGDCDVVIGLRTYSGEESKWRGLAGLSLLVLAHLIVFEQSVIDPTCGFKCFTRDAARRVFSASRVDGDMFDVEILHLMQRFGIRFRFQTVPWRNKGGSRVHFLRRILKDLVDLVAIRLRSTFGIYPGLPAKAAPRKANS